MTKYNNIQIVLLSLMAIYFSQGALHEIGSLLTRTALILIWLISTYYMAKCWSSDIHKNTFFKAWSLLLALNVFGFLLTSDIFDPVNYNVFKGILTFMLPFYPFYYIACKDMIEIKYLRYFLLIMLPINILNFDWSANELLYGRITGNLDIVNNAAYTFVALIPFVFLFKDQKLIPATILAVNLVYIIQGAKRGALIAGLIGLLFFLYYKFKTINTKHLMRDISFVSAVSGTLIYYLYRYYYSKDYIVYRVQMMTEGHTAGRDIIYASIFNNWLGGNILQWFFGFGFAASPRVNDLRGFAHNDWLELLSNFGLLGVFLYFVLFYQGFKTVLSKDFDPHKKVMLSCVLMMWLFISMISMGYLESIFSIMVIVLAFLIGSSIPKEYGANQNPVMVRNANI